METSAIITVITGVLTAIIGAVLGRNMEKAKSKKIDAETESISVQSSAKAVEMWESLNNQLHIEIEKLRVEVVELRGENRKLHIEVNELRGEVGRLKLLIK